jgi:hypothetical protein
MGVARYTPPSVWQHRQSAAVQPLNAGTSDTSQKALSPVASMTTRTPSAHARDWKGHILFTCQKLVARYQPRAVQGLKVLDLERQNIRGPVIGLTCATGMLPCYITQARTCPGQQHAALRRCAWRLGTCSMCNGGAPAQSSELALCALVAQHADGALKS